MRIRPICRSSYTTVPLRISTSASGLPRLPYHWNWQADTNTLVVFKYANRSFLDLASDLSSWGWLDGAGGATGAPKTQTQLLAILNAGVQAYENGQSEFENFARLVKSSTWNGILFLNVPFDLQELPAQLQGLAAGINTDAFMSTIWVSTSHQCRITRAR